MKKLLTITVAAFSLGAISHAEVIYNNFGPSLEYDTLQGWIVDPTQDIGIEFSVTDTVSLTSVLAGLDSSSPSSVMTFEINDGSLGEPGAVLASWSQVLNNGSSAAYLMTDMAGTILGPGTYFLTAHSADTTIWNFNNQGATGFWYTSGGAWFSFGETSPVARIEADVVPEPATLTILALSGIAMMRRKRSA